MVQFIYLCDEFPQLHSTLASSRSEQVPNENCSLQSQHLYLSGSAYNSNPTKVMMRTEEEVKYLPKSKQKLLECVRVSLSSALRQAQVEEHLAILVQQYYINALKWVLGEEEEL